MSIVERIKSLCISKNTTIKALERELNMSNGSIRNWDTSKPSVEKVRLVAERFNVTIDWIITGKDSGNLSPEEKKLVDLYRNTNDIGQPITIKHAEDIQQALPRETADAPDVPELINQQTSSASKIG